MELSDFIDTWLELNEVNLEDGLYKADLLEIIQDALKFYKESQDDR